MLPKYHQIQNHVNDEQIGSQQYSEIHSTSRSNIQTSQFPSRKECASCMQSKTITEFSGKQWNANALRRRCIICVDN